MKQKGELLNPGIEEIKKICLTKPLELYRLVIDGFRQTKGCATAWEATEQGSLEGVLNGYYFMIKTLQEGTFHPDASFLKQLHKACTKNVERLNKSTRRGEFRSVQATYFLGDDNNTSDGQNEIIKKINENGRAKDYYIIEKNQLAHHGYYPHGTNISEQIEKRVQLIFEEYQEKISQKNLSQKEKIAIIVHLIQELEWIHPFADANCRTICVLLLNTLLISQGLSPTILVNPNLFDGASIEELAKDVQNGQLDFEQLLNSKNPKFYFDTHFLAKFSNRSTGMKRQEVGLYEKKEQETLENCIYNSDLYCFFLDKVIFSIKHDDVEEFSKIISEKIISDDNLIDYIILAVKNDSLGIIKHLYNTYDQLKNLNIKDKNNNNIFHLIKSDSHELLLFFIEKNAENINYLINEKNHEGNTPLHLAIIKENRNLIDKLLPIANINIKNNSGKTCLHCAVARNDILTVQALIKQGADLTIQNDMNVNPVQMAIEKKNEEILKIFFNTAKSKEEYFDYALKCTNPWIDNKFLNVFNPITEQHLIKIFDFLNQPKQMINGTNISLLKKAVLEYYLADICEYISKTNKTPQLNQIFSVLYDWYDNPVPTLEQLKIDENVIFKKTQTIIKKPFILSFSDDIDKVDLSPFESKKEVNFFNKLVNYKNELEKNLLTLIQKKSEKMNDTLDHDIDIIKSKFLVLQAASLYLQKKMNLNDFKKIVVDLPLHKKNTGFSVANYFTSKQSCEHLCRLVINLNRKEQSSGLSPKATKFSDL